MGFLFILFPIAEIYVISEVADQIGGFNTFLCILGSAFIGFSLLRSVGNPPRLHRLAAGILFIIPGFITDILAVVVLLPFTRVLFQKWLQHFFEAQAASGRFQFRTFGSGFDASNFSGGTPPPSSRMRDVTPVKPEVIDISPEKKS